MRKVDIATVIKDMVEAIKREKFEIIPYQVSILRMLLEVNAYIATEEVPLYVSYKYHNPIAEVIEKMKQEKYKNKKQVSNGLALYYTDNLEEILIEDKEGDAISYMIVRTKK